MTTLYLTPAGTDRYDRFCYTDIHGNAYVDIESAKTPGENIYTKYPKNDVFFGEPDLPVDKNVEIVFIPQPE